MELEISRGTIYVVAILLFVGVLTLVGGTVTPVDGDGEPLVLSPAYVATVRYLKATRGWLEELEQVDAGLVEVMDGDGNFYDQGRDAERAFQATANVAQRVERAKTPPSLMLLRTAFGRCANAYVQTARLVLIYVSTPSEENRRAVSRGLEAARAEWEGCREMQEGMWRRQ